MTRVDTAFPIDDEVNRQAENSAKFVGEFVVAEGDGVIQSVLLVELAHRLGVVVHGDADYLEALRAVLVLHFGKVGNFFAAGSAPSRPEIEQHHFASIVGERKLAALEIGDGEVRCKIPGCGQLRLGRLLKKCEKQIPRGLKPARDDKNKGLIGTTEVVP